MEPVLHLSLPVRDLDEARRFYLDVLGCRPGRVRDGWSDVWFFGLQVTLQHRPAQVLPDDQQGVRHFGVTLPAGDLDRLLQQVSSRPVRWVEEVHTDFPGTAKEQTKAKIQDPSGHVIELKSYADPAAALEQAGVPNPS